MGKKSAPAQPAQPDPNVVAAAQTASNVATGISNSYLGNANQYGPYGSTTFAVDHYNDVEGHQVPTFNQTTTLSPAEQQKLDQSNQLDLTMGTVAQHQADLIGNTLSTPYAGPGGQPIQRSVNVAQAPTTFGQTNSQVQENVSGSNDWSADRQRVEDALMARINPSLEHDSSVLDTKLANEGFTRGTDAYNRAMDEARRQANDARYGAIIQGGAEQSRLAGLDLAAGQFHNAAQGQEFDQLASRGAFEQGGTQMNNQANIAAGTFGNSATDQQLKTDLAIRNQPINEVSALTGGTQVSLPNSTPYQGGQVAGTPIGDYYMQNAAMANANYQTQLQMQAQQTAALYGGIGSVAGAGMYGLGRRA